jgi:hypothetical protein
MRPLPMTIRGDAVLAWNDGSRSVLTFDVSTNPASGPPGLSATVTAGRMIGSRATGAPLLVNQSGLCGLGGVRSFGLTGGVVTFNANHDAHASRHPIQVAPQPLTTNTHRCAIARDAPAARCDGARLLHEISSASSRTPGCGMTSRALSPPGVHPLVTAAS